MTRKYDKGELIDLLSDLADFLDKYVDVVDGEGGDVLPNAAMRLQTRLSTCRIAIWMSSSGHRNEHRIEEDMDHLIEERYCSATIDTQSERGEGYTFVSLDAEGELVLRDKRGRINYFLACPHGGYSGWHVLLNGVPYEFCYSK